MPATRRVTSYHGPACPSCGGELKIAAMRDGVQACPKCALAFEAHVFHPPQRSARVLQLAQMGPQGSAACANHARNAAVANCERCGLFICSLCEIELENGKFCPSCFERLSADGTVQSGKTRIRDYGMLAAASAALGLLFSAFAGIPCGVLTLYYAFKGRRSEDAPITTTTFVIALFFGVVDTLIGIGFLAAFLVPKAFK
jgi:hypothetical protein